jgi:hypothetical protein
LFRQVLIGDSVRWTVRCALLVAGFGAVPSLASAQELYLLTGGQYTKSLNEKTYAFSFEYLHNLNDHFFATFTWLNEGHVTDHHRDGHSAQIWARWLTDSRRLSLSAGVGPYRYYDTTTGGTIDANTTDVHGFGIIVSAAAHWYISNPWVIELRYNHIYTSGSISTETLLFGAGYQFDASTRPGPVVPTPSYGFSSEERNEVTLMIGKSVVNNFHSPQGAAWAIEYRRNLTPFIDVTGAIIDEGDAEVLKRHGVAAQAWLTREFLEHRASIGLGLGPYVARDEDATGQQTRVLGLLTMTAAWRWSERWRTRAFWYRTVTTDGRDTDIVLLGMGYSF